MGAKIGGLPTLLLGVILDNAPTQTVGGLGGQRQFLGWTIRCCDERGEW